MSATKAQSDVVSVRVGPQDDGTASTSQQSQQLPTFQSPCLFGGASSAIGAGVVSDRLQASWARVTWGHNARQAHPGYRAV